MPFLTVGATNISVAADGVTKEHEVIEDQQRAFSGALRVIRSTIKRQWRVRTIPVARATADTYYTALTGTPPTNCSGDLIGSTVSCVVTVEGFESVAGAGAELVVITFRIREV